MGIRILLHYRVKMEKKYDSLHRWFQKQGGQVKEMAMEPNRYEKDANGNSTTQVFDYEHGYSQMSRHVLATILSLIGQGVDSGDTFRVAPNLSQEFDCGGQPLFSVLVYVSKSFVTGFRGVRDNQPEELLQEVHATTSSFAKTAPPAPYRTSGVVTALVR
jgi:hypothetical protein